MASFKCSSCKGLSIDLEIVKPPSTPVKREPLKPSALHSLSIIPLVTLTDSEPSNPPPQPVLQTDRATFQSSSTIVKTEPSSSQQVLQTDIVRTSQPPVPVSLHSNSSSVQYNLPVLAASSSSCPLPVATARDSDQQTLNLGNTLPTPNSCEDEDNCTENFLQVDNEKGQKRKKSEEINPESLNTKTFKSDLERCNNRILSEIGEKDGTNQNTLIPFTKCPKCLQFFKAELYMVHENTEHDFKCKGCELSFPSSGQENTHIILQHRFQCTIKFDMHSKLFKKLQSPLQSPSKIYIYEKGCCLFNGSLDVTNQSIPLATVSPESKLTRKKRKYEETSDELHSQNETQVMPSVNENIVLDDHWYMSRNSTDLFQLSSNSGRGSGDIMEEQADRYNLGGESMDISFSTSLPEMVGEKESQMFSITEELAYEFPKHKVSSYKDEIPVLSKSREFSFPVKTSAKTDISLMPASTSSMPANKAFQPASASSMPVTIFSQPLRPSLMPVNTSSQPVSTTSMSVNKSAQPVSTYSMPVNKSSMSVNTSSQPVSISSMPVKISYHPVSTSSMPVKDSFLK